MFSVAVFISTNHKKGFYTQGQGTKCVCIIHTSRSTVLTHQLPSIPFTEGTICTHPHPIDKRTALSYHSDEMDLNWEEKNLLHRMY